jgi:hypothetical protein
MNCGVNAWETACTGRAAFALKDVYDNPGVSISSGFFSRNFLLRTCPLTSAQKSISQVATVQTLILSASYHLIAPNKEVYTIDSAWLLLKHACDVAYSIGLREFSPDCICDGYPLF